MTLAKLARRVFGVSAFVLIMGMLARDELASSQMNGAELVAAAGRLRPGDTLVIPNDVAVTQSVRVRVSGVTIDGRGHTLTGTLGASWNVLQFEASGSEAITVRDLTVEGGKIAIAGYNGTFLVENVTVRFAGSHGFFFGGLGDGSNGIMRRCRAYQNGRSRGAGLALGDRARHFAHHWLIEDSEFRGNAAHAGADGETGTGVRICGPQEFLAIEPKRWMTHDIELVRVIAEGNGSSGISAQLAAGVTVRDCISRWNNWNGSAQVTPSGEGYGVRLYGGAGHVIAGGDFSENLATGLCIENDTRCGLSGAVTAAGNQRGAVLVKPTGRLKGEGTLNGAMVDLP